MQRPGPAKSKQREIAWVSPQRQRHHADRPGHFGIGDADHGLGSLGGVKAQFVAKLAGEYLTDTGFQAIQRLAVRFDRRGQATQQQVCIRNRRLAAAFAVTYRAGIGPGALRPDLKQPGIIDDRDGTAASPDRADIDHRHMDRHGIFDLDLVTDGGLGIADQGHIGRRAAHVIGQKVNYPGALAGIGRRHHATGRA